MQELPAVDTFSKLRTRSRISSIEHRPEVFVTFGRGMRRQRDSHAKALRGAV